MSMPRMAEKSPQAFRTISEVAFELDVPQHVLRFWESKFISVKPLKRGGGRRYYRPDDLDLLRGIRSLLYRDGLTIKGVQKILREQGVRYVMELGRGANLAALPPPPPDDEFVPEAEPSAAVPPAMDAPPELATGLNEEERFRLGLLLDELMELKNRLKSARRAVRAI
jgi:DNA-binding transcriptional MerR regulator